MCMYIYSPGNLFLTSSWRCTTCLSCPHLSLLSVPSSQTPSLVDYLGHTRR